MNALYQVYSSETMFLFVSLQNDLILELLNMQNDHQCNDIRLARFENSLSITKKVTLEFKIYYHFSFRNKSYASVEKPLRQNSNVETRVTLVVYL